MAFDSIKEGVKILRRYFPADIILVGRDIMLFTGPKPKELKNEDAEELANTGFFWDDANDCWAIQA